jgi:hypothetical protein
MTCKGEGWLPPIAKTGPQWPPLPPNPPWPPHATSRETTEAMVRNIARELAEIEQALGNYQGDCVASEPANKEFEGLTRQATYIYMSASS